ncbi:hypothetical protein M3I53_31935 [Paraburkholderia sp. CNPSo 3272]|uniref:hypothetical protein n=1 Tax=Paraburkholderia sp. CNPSo 3272 TaxID=2940931 RepID=UPI0020B7D85C|nr:hypothetical protein [Paraburkholderia sp. CNPSo 3272]MCP3727681.1 hypothetical protein [Paraburkholderia sp. CNPSo 3272]
MPMTLQPSLRVEHETQRSAAACVGVHNLDPGLVALLVEHRGTARLLQSVLRVNVVDAAMRGGDELPDVAGRYQLLETGVRFIPRFPFEPGVRYRASFDPQPLGRGERADVLTLEFSLPDPIGGDPAFVTGAFPSADVLPENLLRFYVCFSSPMRRGCAESQISLIGPDGRPAHDVLYRPALELWDRSMRCLTVLLDPGRLKRWVGPNRELGPPLTMGQRYALAVGSAMVDSSGRPLQQHFSKPFVVAQAVRESVEVAHWTVLPPAANTDQPLEIMFPRPLDWALLRRAITVVGDDELPVRGRAAIAQGERRWTFTPASPWTATRPAIRVAPDLEDVCGNNLFEAFDGPLRAHRESSVERTNRTIRFELALAAHSA